MSMLFESLMANAGQENFNNAMALENAQLAGDKLKAVLKSAPSLRVMVAEKLKERFERKSIRVDVENHYITAGSDRYGIENRPSGTLLNVFFECLLGGIYPSYIQDHDFVYSRPSTTGEDFKVSGLKITDVEDVLSQALMQLGSDLVSTLRDYWAGFDDVDPAVRVPRKVLLEEALRDALMAELALTKTAGLLKDYEARRALEVLREVRPPAYKIRISRDGEFPRDLDGGFVLSYAGVVTPNIQIDDELLGWFLYTSDHGFEYFSNSADMHRQLCSRQSVSQESISYPSLSDSVFSHCVGSWMKQQALLFTNLLKPGASQRDDLVADLEGIQQFSAVHTDWAARYKKLSGLIKRLGWPDWLKAADKANQDTYEYLEASRDYYDYEYAQEFDKNFSLRDYALARFSDWSQSALGIQLDPDAISVHCLYRMQVGGRTIEQEDTRTLTEFIIGGLHDYGNRATIRLEGAPASSGLTAAKLENWLHNRDLRTDFVAAIPASPSEMFREACYNRLYSQVEYALFVARHSGIYSDADVALINRGIAGDTSVVIRGVKFKYSASWLKNTLVFMPRGAQTCYAFLKMPGGQFEFLKFSGVFSLNQWLESALSNDRIYAESLIKPEDFFSLGQLIGGGGEPSYYRYELDGAQELLDLDPRAPLASYVDIVYKFEAATYQALAPATYRYAGVQGRQQYARLYTELKALTMVDTRENGYPTFEQFSRELIKTRIEEVLRSRGQTVEVDPDKIIVQTDDFHEDLTSVIVQGLNFEVPNTPGRTIDENPKFYVKDGHPAIDRLDIRDLSSWSKTLRPGDKYTDLLNSDYLNKQHPGYAFKRAVYAKKIRCEMHYDAAFQYFDGRLSQEVFKGVKRVVDSLEEYDGYKDYPRSTEPEGLYKFRPVSRRAVEGVYIFRLSIYGTFHDYLYTPNAPDGTAYRPINEFIGSIRFRYGPFRDYYIARVKLEDQKVVNDYFDNLVATVDTRAPIKPEGLAREFNLYTFHDDRIRRVLSDIDARTTSLNEVIAGLIYDNVIFAANIISLVIPPVGTAVAVVQLLKSVYDGSNAYRQGDYGAALGHARSALIGLLSLGKSALAGRAVKITPTQKTLFDIAKDARTVVGWISQATGQTLGDKRLTEIIEQLMKDNQSRISKTTVR